MADKPTRRASTPRPPGRRLRRWSTGLVVAVLALAVASHAFELGPRVLGWEHPSPITEPAEVAPPPGLSLPASAPASAVATVSAAVESDPQEVRRALARLLRDEDLGPRVAVAVSEVLDGETVFARGPEAVIPASTMKLLTTTAALEVLGPAHTFATAVVAGDTAREVVLVGGGDPLLARAPDDGAEPARADLETLAEATARELTRLGRTRVRLRYDTSLFSGPAVSPDWPASYLPDNVVSPISPLWVDEGREKPGLMIRSEDPARAAAQAFAAALEAEGVRVRGPVRPEAAGPEALEYAAVESAPLAQIVQWVLETSDNEAAEVLFRHVALATGRPGSFEGGSAAVREVLGSLGVELAGARILDGSGLSRRNRLAPATLLDVLEVASSEEHPDLRRTVSGLPVAGFTGSLAYRFDVGADAGLGWVRAKTGTLTGVHGLAGIATDDSGVVFAFVAIADRVARPDALDARAQVDAIAAALAGCRCAA